MGLKMFHLFKDCVFDIDKKQWCKNNGVLFIPAWPFVMLTAFTFGLIPRKKADVHWRSIIIFSSAQAMAFKLVWGEDDILS